MAVDLDDLRKSHDAGGAHSHLYGTMVKIAQGTAGKTVRREGAAKRSRGTHEMRSGVGGYTRVQARRWTRRKTAGIRRRRNKAVAVAALPLAITRSTVKVLGAVQRAPVTLVSWLVIILLLIWLTPLAFPQFAKDEASDYLKDQMPPGMGWIVPGSTECVVPVQVRPVGGLTGVTAGVGSALNRLGEIEPPDPLVIRDAILATSRKVGELLAVFDASRKGAAAPTEPVPQQVPPGFDPRFQPSRGAGGAVVPAVAPTTGLTDVGSVDEVAAAVVAAGQAGEPAAELVAIAGAESNYVREAANPNSSARGYWQVMTGVHDVTEAQAFDPAWSARFAVKLRDESPAGLAGPWAETFGVGAHEQYLPAARAAVARASGGTAAAGAPVACVPGIGGGGGVMQAGLDSAGMTNGALPASVLQGLSWAPGESLRPAAAGSLEVLNMAYRQEFGRDISVTDTYRDRVGQEACTRAKGSMCAKPGTSNHGLGIAVDLGGGIQQFGSREHAWMRANAPAYGWDLPGWAREGGSKPEAWHWEVTAVAVQSAG